MDGTSDSQSAEALALAAQAGSVQAFEQLVTRFEGPLYRYLWMRTHDAPAAEDLVQEAFLRAWQKLARYDSRWRFSTWLYTLAERLCVSARRSRGKEPVPRGGEGAMHEVAAGVDPSRAPEERDEGRALWGLAARVLRPEERSALWLRYGEELSMEEIGSVLGRPAVTVRVLLFRARERLAEALGEERPGPGTSAQLRQNAALRPDSPHPRPFSDLRNAHVEEARSAFEGPRKPTAPATPDDLTKLSACSRPCSATVVGGGRAPLTREALGGSP